MNHELQCKLRRYNLLIKGIITNDDKEVSLRFLYFPARIRFVNSALLILFFISVFMLSATTYVDGQTRGNLDSTFGDGGKISTSISSGWDRANAVASLPDGRIVVAGSSNVGTDFAIVRYNVNGSLDTSLNGTGIVTTHIDNSISAEANGIALQPDGKTIVVGESFIDSRQYFIIVRYNPNGTLDTSFDNDGVVATAVGSGSSSGDQARAVTIQPDGKIVAVGVSYNGTNHDIAVVRYNVNGSLDTSFNGSGKIIYSFGNSSDDYATSLALQPDGKIIVAGATYSPQGDFALVRFNANGTLDSLFGNGGKVTTSISSSEDIIWSVALQPDGKIVVGGDCNINPDDDFALARYNPNGSLDTSFGTGGIVTTFISSGRDQNFGVVLQPDGKIVAAGYNYNGIDSDFALVRYNTNGSLDTLFNCTGIVTTDFSDSSPNEAHAIAIQSGNKFVVAGNTGNALNGNFGVVRYVSDSFAPCRTSFDFDGDARADVSVYRPSNGTWYLNQSASGFSGITFGISTDRIVPADYDGDGKTDVAVYRGGTWYLQRSQAGFLGVSFGASDDIPIPADFSGDGKSEIAGFRPSNGNWYFYDFMTNQTSAVAFGQIGDKPVAADYDGDNKADIAVLRNGTWYIQRSQLGFTSIIFGDTNDKAVPADYDGDGKADVAVFRPSNGTWYLQCSTTGFRGIQFGFGTDIPTPADYDGDGKADVAVFRNGTWYIQKSQAGFAAIQFGTATDKPIPNTFAP